MFKFTIANYYLNTIYMPNGSLNDGIDHYSRSHVCVCKASVSVSVLSVVIRGQLHNINVIIVYCFEKVMFK